MANELKINERALPQPVHGSFPAEIDGPFIASQIMSPAAGHSESAAFNSKSKYLEMISSVAFWAAFGTAPVALSADTTSFYVPANIIVRKEIPAGATKISIIT